MSTIHISQDEAISNFNEVIAKVRAGEVIRIDEDARTIAVIHAPFHFDQPRLLSEVIAGLRENDRLSMLDDKFGEDVEAGIHGRAGERLIDPWESS
jgi:antitoxin (DNA-binding transcriptional repressor) of toxin-antitoxin stability system